MIFTAGRRLTFAASRRLSRDDRAPEENERLYGARDEGAWGTGENYVAHFILTGTPDPATGMIANLSNVADRLRDSVEPRYDHRFLNVDTPPFDAIPPTPENLARILLEESRGACAADDSVITACHLMESGSTGAIAYAGAGISDAGGGGRMEREFRLSFSAARSTRSPHMTDPENLAFFGKAASPLGHGHGYVLRVVLTGAIDETTGLIVPAAVVRPALADLFDDLDHRNLNAELQGMRNQPMTTECLALYVHHRLARSLPVARVRLNETSDLFAETDGRSTSLGLVRTFSAAHRLHNPDFSDEENRRVFGRCTHASGHGHRYAVEATVTDALDERTGTVCNMMDLDRALAAAIGPLDRRHLDREVDDFRRIRSSSENILGVIWRRLEPALDVKLTRLRVQETENNRFALRAG